MVTAPSSGFDITPTTKLYISNLDYNVSNEDIKDLFSEMGEIKRYSINYDKSGRSKGTAEVVFSTKAEYNNVQLDGKPMKIEVIGINTEAPAPASAIFTFARPPLPGNFSFPPKRNELGYSQFYKCMVELESQQSHLSLVVSDQRYPFFGIFFMMATSGVCGDDMSGVTAVAAGEHSLP
ncbi:hypothetical protein QYE76_010394 [Lolium multiflorum]|uniref:RRM domain-containing protein n=1 Tax=Lolium multiflorum TaxID=4521 RepID=A0AAD8TVH7_LOLMU|nr:hypothetical protein QYE76_010394 [Lolium multiflorum]